jgi:hypothetical protein
MSNGFVPGAVNTDSVNGSEHERALGAIASWRLVD